MMNRKQFIKELKVKTKHLSRSERNELISYYNEMISERIENGMTEAEAVEAMGSVDDILLDFVPTTAVKKREPVRLKAGHIVLIVLGSPVWIALLAAAFCVLLAFYIIIWAVVVCFYAVFAAFAVSALALFVAGAYSLFTYGPGVFMTCLGAGAVLAGIAVFWLMLCNVMAKGIAKLTKVTAKGIFRLFFNKRG